ncbi:tRNA lysidine(34) synthetase TilS [Roseibium sp.]|uniref:tRNA lysidine(34) synthetase TilS n=1 Tax=Roseibium sp. TaxID=1936156 RepID=UPI003B50BA39
MHNAPDSGCDGGGLSADEADTLFSRLIPFSNLALAVSGGSDSLCLLVLFSEWRQRNRWEGSAEILVVDHGLRPESAAEAEFVRDAAGNHGLAAQILRWEGPKPASNVQDGARRARYRLMAARIAETGAQALLLGHHMDDQAETFLDRLTRGSGIAGLSAMAIDEPGGPEGLRLLRPFLGVRKSRLEASLDERGLDWCRDPSNDSTKYKRSRLRRIMALLEAEGLTAARLSETAGRMRRSRAALESVVHDIAARLLEHHRSGPARIERAAYRELQQDLRLRLLAEMVLAVTGRRPEPRLRQLETLDDLFSSGQHSRQTLCGATFEAGSTFVWCWREAGRTPPETLDRVTGSGVWDRRYRYAVPAADADAACCEGLRLGPLMHAPITRKDIIWPQGWPKSAFECSPVVWDAQGAVLAHTVCLKSRTGENNHSCSLDLERVPIRGRLLLGGDDKRVF